MKNAESTLESFIALDDSPDTRRSTLVVETASVVDRVHGQWMWQRLLKLV
jgi:hypothetical protein